MTWTFLALQTAPAGEKYEKDFLALAASLAAFSAHPAAADLRRVAKGAGVSDGPVVGFKDFPGKGFGGVVQLPGEEMPRAVLMGELDFLEECGLHIPALLEVARRRFSADGARALVGGWDGHVRGVMRFRDGEPGPV